MATSPVTTRLTARGRLLLGASGLVILLSLISANTALGSAQGGAARSAALSQGYESITVLPGESLWSIAREIAPDFSLSTGDIVGMIIEINNLPSSELASGQELLIPAA
jgi:hypothetical protein